MPLLHSGGRARSGTEQARIGFRLARQSQGVAACQEKIPSLRLSSWRSAKILHRGPRVREGERAARTRARRRGAAGWRRGEGGSFRHGCDQSAGVARHPRDRRDCSRRLLAIERGGWLGDLSHIALSTLTSLFPFLIFVTALAGFFGSQNLSDEAARLIFDAWPPIVANPIVGEVHNVLTAPRGGLLTIGAILALYFSSGAIEALRVGLDRAYERPRRGRGGCCGWNRSPMC